MKNDQTLQDSRGLFGAIAQNTLFMIIQYLDQRAIANWRATDKTTKDFLQKIFQETGNLEKFCKVYDLGANMMHRGFGVFSMLMAVITRKNI